MRVLSTRMHGVVDYTMGILLIVSPYLFGFATGGVQQWVPMIMGAIAISYSLLTRYEFGAIRLIPMRVHLGLDALHGVLLAASPWLFGFSEIVFWPHLLLGLVELGAVAVTEPAPGHMVETRS